MLTVTSSSGFGAPTAQQQALIPQMTASGQSLAVAETSLRNTFGRLASIQEAYNLANKPVPPALTALMRKYNVAQVAYTEAANFWLIARLDTPKDQLPDPNAVPQAVPAFDIPASGFGGAMMASDIGIIAGPWTNPQRMTLGEYRQYASATQGLGAFIVVAIFIIALVAITAAVIISVFGKSQAAADIAANQAATAKALARVAEVESDERTLQNLLNACIGGSTDATVRFNCAQLALEKLPGIQGGRPSTDVVAPRGTSIFAIVGVVAALGVAGATGYYFYRRYKYGQARLPRARAAY